MTIILSRRNFIAAVGGSTAFWPLATRAQQRTVKRVGILMPYPAGDSEFGERVQAFRQELAKLGWTEGENIRFDERWTTANMDLVRAGAASLMQSNQSCGA